MSPPRRLRHIAPRSAGRARSVAALVAAASLVACTETTQTRPAEGSQTLGPIAAGARFTPPPLESVTRAPKGWEEAACGLDRDLVARIRRGHFPGRSPDVFLVPREPNFFGSFRSTSHSGPWDYLQEVPLAFYGSGIKRSPPTDVPGGSTLADVAPTLARLLETDWPADRPGRVLDVVQPRSRPPRLIVVIVWDGGGWNVLRTWPNSWPYLKRLMRDGTSITNVTVGSSPSVTPAVHATLATGAFPNDHGVIDMWFRYGGVMATSFGDNSPRHLELETVADLYDRARRNLPLMGMMAYRPFHTLMLGHGAYSPGGDRDIQVIAPPGPDVTFIANEGYYDLPDYLDEIGGFEDIKREVDSRDGRTDGAWLGNPLDDRHVVRHSPVWVRFQTKVLKTIIRREGFGQDAVPDLFFVNYKQIDDAGHDWNMLRPEVKHVIVETDDSLRDLAGFLDREVGEGRWAAVITADHGQGPDPLASRAWPIAMGPTTADVHAHFGSTELVEKHRPTGFWLSAVTMAELGITAADVADFFVGYRLADNLPEGEALPAAYRTRARELIFEAAFPSDAMDEVWSCARRNR